MGIRIFFEINQNLGSRGPFCAQAIPSNILKPLLLKIGQRLYYLLLVPKFPQCVLNQLDGKGRQMLFKNCLPDNFSLRLVCVKDVDGYGAVRMIIPKLYVMDPHAVWPNEWGGKEEPLLPFHRRIPISGIQIQIPAGTDQAVHFAQGLNDTGVVYMGQRVSGAHYTAEIPVKVFG